MLRLYDNAASETLARVDVPEFAVVTPPADTTTEAADLTPFLDQIIGRLRSLPDGMHEEIRRELRAHLESLIAAHEELGLNREDALIAAIGQFGDPTTIARRFRRAYESTLPVATPWAAMRETLRVFGAGILVYTGVVRIAGAVAVGPHHFAAGLLAAILLWVFPLIAGGWVGRRTPRRAALGVVYGLSALTFAATPFIAYMAYRVGDVSPQFLSGNQVTLALMPCLLLWFALGAVSAAATSRMRWTTGGGISPLPAFAARALGLSMLAAVVNQTVPFGFWPSLIGAGEILWYVLTLVMMVFGAMVPISLGWQIGRVWPITETWTRKQAAYLLAGSGMASIGVHIVSASSLWGAFQQHDPTFHVTFNASPGLFLFNLAQYFFIYCLPLASIAALVSANKARRGNPLLVRGVGVAALFYVALDEYQTWYYHHNASLSKFHGGSHRVYLFLAFPCLMLAVFAAVLYASRNRMPLPVRKFFRAA